MSDYQEAVDEIFNKILNNYYKIAHPPLFVPSKNLKNFNMPELKMATKSMTKKELKTKLDSLQHFCEGLKKDIVELREYKDVLEKKFKTQTEINNLLANELGGKIVEEDYVGYKDDTSLYEVLKGTAEKIVRTRQVFKKFDLVGKNPKKLISNKSKK